MSTCLDCFGTYTNTPCDSVGCLSTNYGKCITYSGLPLACGTGAISTVSKAGLALSPTVITEYTVSPTGGSGSGASVKVTRTPGSNAYTVTLLNGGSGYTVGNFLTVLGTSLGGATPANDLTLQVTTLAAIINTGANLDVVVSNLHQRICNLTASGLDYSAYSYSCLRVGGALTGIGTAITTAQQFVESTASALCSLNTRTLALETPTFTVPGCISLTSGVSTLSQILTAYGSKICTINTSVDMTGVLGNPCIAFAFSTKPTSTVVSDYFNWVTSNMCSMYQDLSSDLVTTGATVASLKTYVAGVGSIPASINTSCIPGGSSTSTLSAAAILFTSQICAINTALASIPATNYALTWATNFGSTAYYGYTFNYTNTSTTLQTQLDRVVATLGRMKLKLNPAHFTATSDSDGLNISLVSTGGGATPSFVNLTAGTLTNAVVVSSARFPIGSLPKLQKYGNVVTIIGSLAVNATGSFTWTHGQSLTIANIPAGYAPLYTQVFDVLILKYATTSGTPSTAVYHGACYLNGTDLVVELNNPAASVTLSGTESLEIFVGGRSYAV